MSGKICSGCGKISFKIGEVRCSACRALLTTPARVDFTPSAEYANPMIEHLHNVILPTKTPQDFATYSASALASVFYLMLENNKPEAVQEIAATIIADCVRMRAAKVKKHGN